MAEGNPTLAIAQTVLLAGVLVTTTMVTCSNSRLEERVIKLEKTEPPASPKASTERLEGQIAELSDAVKALASRPVVAQGPAVPGDGTHAAPDAPRHAASGGSRRPGEASDVEAVGWGGRRAKVTYVEGAAADAPLRLEDKPLPQGDWYVDRRNSPPKSLNYFATNEGDAARMSKYILQTLMTIDYDSPPKVQPRLATSWEVSDDKLTYIYHLRRGVQFADGRPFTSADVRFSFDVMRDMAVKADHLRGEFEQVDSLETPDPFTVVVKYKTKFWKGIYSIGVTLRVLNKAWYEEQIPIYAKKLGIEKWDTEPGKPGFGEVFNKIRIPCPGPGPYYIASDEDFTRDYVIERQNPFSYMIQIHPDWFNLKQIRWVFINDDQAADEAFRKQDFDVTVVDHDRWADALSKDPLIAKIANHYVYDHIALDCSLIYWNCRRPPFDDPRTRRAMTMLVDREWILRDIERGNGTIAVCRSKRSYPEYSNELPAIPFDVEGAKKLLAEAGWKDTDGDGVLDKDGVRFEWELKYPSGRRFYTRVCEQIADACKKVGIRMKQNGLEWATFQDDLEQRKFDAVILYNSFSDCWVDLYSEGFHSSQDVPAGGNVSGWRNSEVDAITDPMREEFDDAKRIAMYHRFNKIFYDEQPQTLLVHGTVAVMLNKRFEGAKVRPVGLEIIDLWVKPENVLHR
jgi:peptide/nickel transport system substrate-binding protein